MISHKPAEYECPYCRLRDGQETHRNMLTDIVTQNDHAIAFVAPRWHQRNQGHVLVVPRTHYENIYDIPPEELAEVYLLVQRIAIAMRSSYDCDGISTRQHNEPAGDQRVWHLHVHVLPRYEGDNLYQTDVEPGIAAPELRAEYAAKLKAALSKSSDNFV